MITFNFRTAKLISAIAAIPLLAGTSTQAANGTWTQLTSGGLWSNTVNWSGGTVADGSGFTADFSTLNITSANIVHLDGARTLSALTFADTTTPFVGWTLDNNGSAANILTLAGTTPSITVGTSSTAEISAEIAGSTNWSKAGTGTLTLSGSNTFSGNLTVSTGRLVVSNNNALGTTGGTNSVTTGAALVLANGVNVTGETVTINGTGSGDFFGALNVAANTSATWNGTVILGSSSRVGAGDNGTLTLSGAIQGIGSQPLQVRGNNAAATIIVSSASGSNTYSGNTQVVQGTLKLGAANTLPTGTTLDVDSSNASVDAIFDLNGFNQTVAGLQRTGAGSGTGGSFVTNSGSAATLTINQTASTTYSGNITGSLALTKSGAGTLTLTGTNSNTGATIISGGTLAIGTGGHLSTSSAITNNANLTANSTGSLTQGTHFSGAAITGNGSFTQLGSGTTTLNTANTFSGVTLISAGKIALGHTLALQNSAYDTTGSIGAIGLDVTGFTAPTLGGLRGSVALATAITGYSAVTNLILNPQTGASNSYSGVIANGAAGLTVTKTGAGTQVLSGNNTFTGQLTVAEGAISVSTVNNSGADGVLGNSTSSVILGSTGKSGALSFNTNVVTATKKFTMAAGGTGIFDVTSGQLAVGLIDGSGALSKTGAGNLVLGNANTFSGGATLGGSGFVAVNVDSAGPAGAPTSGALGTGTVNLAGAQIRAGTTASRTIGNNVTISADTPFATIASEKSLTFTGTILLSGGNHTLNVLTGSTVGTEKLTFSGAIGDGGNALGITKTGAGNLVLSGNNTYTGATTVSAGSLAIGSAGSLASGNALTVGASGLATFANAGQTLGAVSNANTTTNALNFSASTGTVTLASLSGAGNTTFGSNGIVTGDISAGTVTSVGNLTANISGGTTTVGGVATIGTLSGGTANLNGATSAITTLNGGTVNLGSGTALTVSGGTSAGVITGTGSSLTKTSSGTLTLTGTNTYTGTTTVSAGTLALNNPGTTALVNTSAVVIASGASVSLGAANQINAAASLTLNGGTMDLGVFSQTLGTLDLNASSALSLSGSAALVFANSSALDWNSATLSVSHFEVGTNSLRFGTTSGGLTATQLGLFRFVEFGNVAARIDDDGFIVPLSTNYLNSGGTDLVIATPITGTTTVNQSGTGSITLTGLNTSSGTATVTAGTLVIGTAAGGHSAGNVTVSGTGTLKGRGDIGGAVIVNSGGTYSPGNSPAIQHVGSLTVNTGGSVTIELDGATAGTGAGFHDQVISAGAVTLTGGTLIGQTIFTGSSVPAYVPTLGAVHAVITGSAVTGKFTSYTFDPDDNAAGITWLPEYTATAVNLYAVPSDYATAVPGLNANQTQVGAALQSLRNLGLKFELDQRTTMDDRATLFNGLKTQTAAGLRTAYDQLTPEKLTALAASTFQSASILNSSLQQRSAEIRRYGPASVSLNGVARPAAAEAAQVETVIEDGVHYRVAKAKPQKRYGYFASATGAFAAVDGSVDRLGSFSQTGAATAGVDYAINQNQTVGLVVSQALADTDFSANSGSARTTTSRVGLFHDYHNAGFFMNTSVSAGFSDYDSKRKIAFLNQTASGETQGFSCGGQLSTGYDFKVGNYIMGPTASVAYDHAHINGFDETGSAADLRVGRQNADSLTTRLGVHVSRPFVANKIGWIPDLSLSASRQSFNPNSITARLAAGGDAFRVNPQAGGSEYINPGASLSAVLPTGWTVRLSYDAILNPQSAEYRVNLSVGAGF
ncbi:MAG: autotransporter domain-containing protein [Opitutus sp.]|nr:autotransporter domain-containing protein [Opitutus sp.]